MGSQSSVDSRTGIGRAITGKQTESPEQVPGGEQRGVRAQRGAATPACRASHLQGQLLQAGR